MLNDLSLFDLISVSLILILGIKGIINGFVKEVFGLIGIIGGIYLASRFAKEAGTMIETHLYHFGNQASMYLFGFITVLVLFWVASLFVGYLIAQALRLSGLSMMDKLAGFLVGSLKIFFVFSIFAVTLNQIEFVKTWIDPYVQKSMMYPIFTQAGNYIVKIEAPNLLDNSQPPSEH